MKKINYYIGKIVYKTIESRIIEDSSEENVVYATKYVKADKYSLLYSYDDETLVNTEQFDVVKRFNDEVEEEISNVNIDFTACGVSDLARIYSGPSRDNLIVDMLNLKDSVNELLLTSNDNKKKNKRSKRKHLIK